MTCALEGLWDLRGSVTAENIRHMKGRVEQFEVLAELPQGSTVDVPMCKASFAKWLLGAAAAFAQRRVVAPLPVELVDGGRDENENEQGLIFL